MQHHLSKASFLAQIRNISAAQPEILTPMTLRIKEALAAAPPCDTFDTKLYHAIADKIVLHRTTPIQLKLINGMVV